MHRRQLSYFVHWQRVVIGLVFATLACKRTTLEKKERCADAGRRFVHSLIESVRDKPWEEVREDDALFAYNEPADTCLCRYIIHFSDERQVPTNSRHIVVDTLSNMQITTYNTVLDATDANAKRRYDAVLDAMLGNKSLPPPPK